MSAPALVRVLERARDLGFLGPGPVEAHIEHADGYVAAAGGQEPAHAVDLGSGGGVPGLVLALRWPSSRWMLLDASERRTEFLARALPELGLGGRVDVVRARAEEVGRLPEHRGAYDLVTARSFGGPSVTAECAAPLLRVGGKLLVSEPPSAADRWPDAVTALGLLVGPRVGGVRVLEQSDACPDGYPRRVGVPARRPLF